MKNQRIASFLALPVLCAAAAALVQPQNSGAAAEEPNDGGVEQVPVEDGTAVEQVPVEDGTGVDPGAGVYFPIDGYVETHVHNLSRYGFGGGWVHGESGAGATDPSIDLAPCEGDDHAISWLDAETLSRLSLGLVDQKIGGEIDRIGHPLRTRGFNSDSRFSFVDWPIWASVTHSQVHPNWIEELVRGETDEVGVDSPLDASMKVFVLSAVNLRPLCDLLDPANLDGDPNEDRCADDVNLERQIEKAWEMSHRNRDGTLNPGGFDWFQIVRTPSELRAAVAAGRLAVVLHLEASELMKSGVADDALTYRNVEQHFWHYFDLGVRSFQLVHEYNNQFGGTAPFKETGVLRALAMLADAHRDERGGGVAQLAEVTLSALFVAAGGRKERRAAAVDRTGLYERYAIELNNGGYNKLGLTEKGNYLARIAMCENVLVDTAHMGGASFWDAWEASTDGYSGLSGEAEYPLFHSHTRFRALQHPLNASEYNTSDSQIQAIQQSGGMIGLRTGTTPVASTSSPVPNDCQGTSKTWAQSYAYAVGLGVATGVGTDMPSAVSQVRPRYVDVASKYGQAHNGGAPLSVGPHDEWACGSTVPNETGVGGRRASEQALQDPADMVGSDFDLIGLGRYNLLDDMMIDVEGLGQSVSALKNTSAETFASMWERAYEANASSRSEAQAALCAYTREDVDEDGEVERWEVVRDAAIGSDDDMVAHLGREAIGAKEDRGELDEDWRPPRKGAEPPIKFGGAAAQQPLPPPGMVGGEEDVPLPCAEGVEPCPLVHPSGEPFPPVWLQEWWMESAEAQGEDEVPPLEQWQLDYLGELQFAEWVSTYPGEDGPQHNHAD